MNRAVVVGVAGVVGAAAAVWALAPADPPRVDVAVTLRAPSLMAAGSFTDNVPAAAPHTTRPTLAPFQTGSLRGTDFPPWGVARGETLTPNRTLRDRFDHYLLAIGETTPAALTSLVAAQATHDLGEFLASDVLALWGRYLRLQQHPFQHVGRNGDPDSLDLALQERRQVRQGLLGLRWAQAFYADEETALSAAIDRARAGTAAPRDEVAVLLNPPPGTDPATLHRQRVAHFGAEKAERLRRLDDDQAAWDRRLAEARVEFDALKRDPALSATQRDEAVSRLLAARFHGSSEQLRASSLLGL